MAWRGVLGLCVVSGACVACGGEASSESSLGNAPLELSAGGTSNCALTQTGEVYCWGELGVAKEWDPVLSPKRISGIEGKVVALDTGGYHSCVLTDDHSVWCWGYNIRGQVGVPESFLYVPPTEVASLRGQVAQVSAGDFSTCALLLDGRVMCWGYGGDGTVPNSTEGVVEPEEMQGFAGRPLQIEVGNGRACALIEGGREQCWGSQALGEWKEPSGGMPPLVDIPFDAAVARLLRMTGTASCAVLEDARVACSGLEFVSGVKPEQVFQSPVVDSIDVGSGDRFACFESGDGRLSCFGDNWSGQLGVENKQPSATFVEPGVGAVRNFSVGPSHVCAQDEAGVWCWGDNWFGQLGYEGDEDWRPHRINF